jgi:hypothetical protein
MMMPPSISLSPAPAGHEPAPKAGFVFLGSSLHRLAANQRRTRIVAPDGAQDVKRYQARRRNGHQRRCDGADAT